MARRPQPTRPPGKKKKPPPRRRRKSIFSGLRREWMRNPAEQVIDSGKAYDRRQEKRRERRARKEAQADDE